MKKIIVICLSVILSISGFAQSKPVIEFEKMIHDFGKIKEKDGIASYTFVFTNKGNTPLVINEATSSCGCTTPEWTKAPVAPGKKGTIKVGYNPYGRPGPFDKTISIKSNASVPNVVLHIKGDVEQKVLSVEEEYPIAIGSLRLKSDVISMVRMANTAAREDNSMEIINTGTSPIIVSFENIPAHIKLQATPISLGAKQKGTIKCTYFAAKKNELGPVSDFVTLKANQAKGKIEVRATIEQDISKLSKDELEKAPTAVVSSSSHDFNSIKKGQQVTASYQIKNTGKSDLVISKITPDCKCIQATASPQTIKPGQSGTIKAVLNSANEEGNKFYNIIVTTNAPNQQMVNLFMTGSITK